MPCLMSFHIQPVGAGTISGSVGAWGRVFSNHFRKDRLFLDLNDFLHLWSCWSINILLTTDGTVESLGPPSLPHSLNPILCSVDSKLPWFLESELSPQHRIEMARPGFLQLTLSLGNFLKPVSCTNFMIWLMFSCFSWVIVFSKHWYPPLENNC